MTLTDEGLVGVPGLLSRWVRLGSGCAAHYMTAGESGPAVILLHGGMWGASGGAGWSQMAPFLGANGFRVYCPDMPGFGLTDHYEHAYPPDLSGHLDFLQEFVTALCLDRFHIAGNSMGCQNAVNYVTAHPKKILSFALISGAVEDLVSVEELLASSGRPKGADRSIIFEFDGTEESMRRIMQWLVDDPSTISDEMVAMRTRAAAKHMDYFRKMNEHLIFKSPDPDTQARMSIKGRFDRLSIPGIYLYGTKDHLPPEIGGYPQEDALPNVQFFYPENTGHQGQTDSPELFNQVFLEFFRDGEVSWDTAQAAGISTRRPPLPHVVSVPAPTRDQ
ncbi:alpha/beta hydrolase [Mycolicibacterium elephantis]|uniref:alpha/beta fold hydrolase n=1 Tax=Mycolicibacterium elephantis TaxID=81858 RepID=UPI0006294012|nr:alpha/beta hydrolase [Mycolicibacterium elephantis]KKW65828.1 2-hydroxy-6-oxo-6-phenylhexa-2,4-dienoate hydrolase [Mycolicibacterium elephantis]OBB16464.1 2-hydroxy-6-oxo-6-phenylhexa-2,4-dienoate hydrolase [Mycolicibacterium elephantis]OBE94916.1 2-hydroxy-6-oxo-6-phenylhexa-2,4-dienoate hydrolase [Mycolicibacterium elephantis]